ncbi:MAG: UDP-N-acetylmuramate dehydrogenase [Verrucomicrobiales bacterium]|nr:UDP-N-acetylmuramate dehydrogenase [Verrucomicrobiales bacterium]
MNTGGTGCAVGSNRAAEVAARLRGRVCADTVVRVCEPLAAHTTLRVGGPADVYVEPASEQDLSLVLKLCREEGLPWLVIGRGSNLLVKDGGFRGVVIRLAHKAFARIEVVGTELECGSGAMLKDVFAAAAAHGIAGFEFMDGIPGTVGGALRMNAGAMGAWTFDLLERVRYMDAAGAVGEAPRAQLAAEYRGCTFFDEHVALSAVFRGTAGDPAQITARAQLFRQKRQLTQPAGPSAGCVFKNPPGAHAGKLIDELGLKRARVGGAFVSEKHANFILTEPGATAADVLRLIELIRERVRTERGIELETEVRIIGEER